MSDTTTRDEKRSALDEFAARTMKEPGQDVAVTPVPPAGLPAIHGAQQIAVKRDTRQVLAEIRELAAAAGSSWFYRWPVRDRRKGTTSWVEGGSIKMANDVARIFGNCEIDCRVTDLGQHFLFHARFVDLETGYALTRPFQQRKSAAKMGDDAERREDMALQIGASKAIRNVTLNALQTYADFALEEARGALVDKIGADLPRWRERTVERITKLVSLDRVEAVIGRPAKDWLAPDVAKVVAMGSSINDGMASTNEVFPPLHGEEEAEQVKSALDQFADKVEDAETSEVTPTSPSTSVSDEAVAEAPSPAAAIPSDLIKEIVLLASDSQTTPQERLEMLEGRQPAWEDRLPGDERVTTAFRTAASIVTGRMRSDAAEKYLRGLFGL